MELNTILPILTAIISSYLTYYFAIKSKRDESILKYKEEKYANLLVLLQGFFGTTANSKIKKEFFEEQYKSWLYSSDEVIEAINKMTQLVIESNGTNPNPEEGKKAVGNIIVAIRKDLLGKTTLDYSSFRYTDVIN